MRRELYPTKTNNVNTQKLNNHVKEVKKVEAQSNKGLFFNLFVVLFCVFGLVFLYNRINKQDEISQNGNTRNSQPSQSFPQMKTSAKSSVKNN